MGINMTNKSNKAQMENENKLSLIKEIVDKLAELEDPSSEERITVLEGKSRKMDGTVDVTDSYLVGHYMGQIRHIGEILKKTSTPLSNLGSLDKH
jgi:hypothetical protein